jgi:hypothetical protein
MPTAEDYVKMSDSEKKKEDWMNSKWRPLMGYVYMLTCIMDFVVFPVLWSLVQVIGGGEVRTQWSPITLQGAGLFHMAMGAILGIAAYGRTQEKMAGANNGGIALPTPSFVSPAPTPAFGAPASPAPAFGAPKPTPVPAFGAPVQPPHPEI